MIPRVIPCLTTAQGRLVKTTQFANAAYVGDPINAVRIFNDKEADELVVLDIDASRLGTGPDLAAINEIVTEAFMPVAYGGGIASVEIATRLIQVGVEKVVVNTAAAERPKLIAEISDKLGSSTLIVGIDARANRSGGYEVVGRSGTFSTGRDVVEYASEAARLGAGEILLTSVDRDGTRDGYDCELVRTVAEAVEIPVIACGGAGKLEDLRDVVESAGASAAAAGSLFVFHGSRRAVLITYPAYEVRIALFRGADRS